MSIEAQETQAGRDLAIKDYLAYEVKHLREVVKEFAAKLEASETPSEVFEWGDKAFSSACKLDIIQHLAAMPVAEALAVAQKEAIQGARWPKQSTSVLAKLAYECKTSVYAEFYAEFSKGREL